MKVAVLGARGFIGTYLCTYLWTMNYDVLPVVRETVDLADYTAVDQWLETHKPDIVVNAAISGGGVNVDEKNFSDLENNLTVFFNFFNSYKSFRYINIGSGAEFDKSKDIYLAYEPSIVYCKPKDTYGLSKNIISRCVTKRNDFLTLRLFGCFHKNEPEFRLFKKFLSGQFTVLQDRYFDYFSLEDFVKVVEYFCRPNTEISLKDINCVYSEKYKLSEILSKLKKIKNLDIPIYTDGVTHYHYTGSSMCLDTLRERQDFPKLAGLEKGLEKYE